MIFSGLIAMIIPSLIFITLLSNTIGLRDENLEIRFRRLNELSNANPVVRFNHDLFRALAQSSPRNYSIILLMVALAPNRGCTQCKEALEQFKLVANSWKFAKNKNGELHFGVVDFDEAHDVFDVLNLRTAPAIIHVGPKGGIKSTDYMEIHHLGYSAHSIAEWVKLRTSIQIRVLYPPSYTGTMLLTLFMTLGGAALWFRRSSLDYLFSVSLWRTLALGIIFCAISGQVYNQIRGPPLLHATREGEIKALIYPSSDFQFVAETLIVMGLYILATLGIVLILQVDETTDQGKKKVYLFGGVALFSLAFSLVLSIFRRKYQGYPYSFFFK